MIIIRRFYSSLIAEEKKRLQEDVQRKIKFHCPTESQHQNKKKKKMYNPFEPTNIKAYRIRLREEEESQRQLAVEAEQRVTRAAGTSAGPPVMMMMMASSPEEIHRLRVEASASLGIKAAKEALDEDADLQNKLKKHEGTDRASKMARLLSNHGERSADATARTLEGLKFTAAGLAAGGHKITASEGSGPKAAPFRGKPSSTLLLSGWCAVSPMPDGGLCSSSSQWMEGDQCLAVLSEAQSAKAFARLLQQSCGAYGVVRGGRLGCIPPAAGQEQVTTTFWRLFLRFDSVSSAFRAAEALNGKSIGELWERVGAGASRPVALDPEAVMQAAFYSTAKYDGGSYTEVV